MEGGPQQFQYGEQLYDLTAQALSQEFSKWSHDLCRLSGSQAVWLEAYRGYWVRMKEVTPHVSAIFSYLERFWVERGGDNAPDNKKGDEEGKATLYFRQRMYQLWVQWFLNSENEVRLHSILDECVWGTEPSPASEEIVESYKFLSVPFAPGTGTGTSKRPTGIRVFEERLLPWYRERLAQRAGEFVVGLPTAPDGSLSLTEVQSVYDGFQRECDRARMYLGEEALSLVKDTLKKSLLEPVMPRLQALFQAHLSHAQEPFEGLRLIFQVAALRRTLIPSLGPALTTGILSRSGLADNLSLEHIEYDALMRLWLECRDLMLNAFKDNEHMRRARDSAFITLMKKAQPRSFARWSDLVLRQECAEAVQEGVARLMALTEDRQAFITAYHHALGPRLLSNSHDLAREQAVIAALKGALGGGLVQPFDRMLMDMQTNGDAAAVPLHNKKRGRTISTTKNACGVQILAQSAWPFGASSPDDMKDLILPADFQQLCAAQEASYRQTHPKRRLQWRPELSTVEVSLNGALLRLCIPQLVVLDALSYSQQDMSAVSLKTGMEASAIRRAIEQPIAVGLVDPHRLALNSSFGAEALLDLTGSAEPRHHPTPSQIDPSAETLMVGPDHGASNRAQHILQAAITRLLKQRVPSSLSQQEIVDNLRGMRLCVPVDSAEVNRALASLIAREFVSHDARMGYQYLP